MRDEFLNDLFPILCVFLVELQTKVHEDITITEMAPTKAFKTLFSTVSRHGIGIQVQRS